MTFLVTGEGSKEFLLNCLHKTRSKTVLTSPRHQGRFFFLATWTAQHSKYCSRSGKCYRRTLKWKNTRLQLKSAFDKMATWRNVSAVSLFFSSYDGWNIGWNVFKLITESVWSYSSGHKMKRQVPSWIITQSLFLLCLRDRHGITTSKKTVWLSVTFNLTIFKQIYRNG